MKRLFSLFFVALGFSFPLCAQTVTHVVAKQVGNTVEITYDLDQDANVSLLLSRDGGASYSATPRSLTGDVGDKVPAGVSKKIVWNLLADGTDWDIERARFKVIAEDKTKKVFTVNGMTFTMIAVEGGRFVMGATPEQGKDAYYDEKPTHNVTLSDFYIGQTEVTQGLWKAVMGSNPASFNKGDNYPVENVSWEDCQAFVDKLNFLLSSQLNGKHFRLPTEAQWEYAARGGKQSKGYKYSGSNTLGSVAWFEDNSNLSTHPVATKSPNELGIYDMSGNVWERCQDLYGSYGSSSQANPSGASSGHDRVNRGGGWEDEAGNCRISRRYRSAPSDPENILGLRLVCQ